MQTTMRSLCLALLENQKTKWSLKPSLPRQKSEENLPGFLQRHFQTPLAPNVANQCRFWAKYMQIWITWETITACFTFLSVLDHRAQKGQTQLKYSAAWFMIRIRLWSLQPIQNLIRLKMQKTKISWLKEANMLTIMRKRRQTRRMKIKMICKVTLPSRVEKVWNIRTRLRSISLIHRTKMLRKVFSTWLNRGDLRVLWPPIWKKLLMNKTLNSWKESLLCWTSLRVYRQKKTTAMPLNCSKSTKLLSKVNKIQMRATKEMV